MVILCAGASSRLGEPKALARLGHQVALDWVLEAATPVDPSPLIVAGRHFSEVQAHLQALPPGGPTLTINEHWQDGRTGSLAAAARERPGADLLVAPVDVPLVTPTTFQSLASTWETAGSPPDGWLAPWTAGPRRPRAKREGRRFGHPILLGCGLAASILEDASPARPLSQYRAMASPLLGLEVEDSAIHDDLDTPDDLAVLRGRLGRR